MTDDIFESCRKADLIAVATLLKNGVQVNAQDARGMTALHWAVFGGYIDVASLLLQAGANPNLPSNEGPHATPYWHAKEDFGMQDIAALMQAFGGRAVER
jgi:ankyrin repeat protein